MDRISAKGRWLAPLIVSTALFIIVWQYLEQRKTIAGLRQSQEDYTSVVTPAPSASPPPASPEMPHSEGQAIMQQEPAEVLMSNGPAVTPQANAPLIAELEPLRQENVGLKSQIRELEAQISRIQAPAPEPEDSRASYIGPGIWINPDAAQLISKVEITGLVPRDANPPVLTARFWSNLGDELAAVPLHFLNYRKIEPKYQRALAVWDSSLATYYVVIIFERSDLKVEVMKIDKRPSRGHMRLVHELKRT